MNGPWATGSNTTPNSIGDSVLGTPPYTFGARRPSLQGIFGFPLFDGGEGGTGAVLVDDVVVTELR
jgi:hypothetical protein